MTTMMGILTVGMSNPSVTPMVAQTRKRECSPFYYMHNVSGKWRTKVADREIEKSFQDQDTPAPAGHLGGGSRNGGRTALLRAQKISSVPIMETEKPISTYMTLPASQYSVLDAKKIERIDEDTFVCYVGGINFLGVSVEPVLTLSVIVGERGPTVRMLEVTLEGSVAAQRVNEKFSATMENIVEWQEEEHGGKLICSNTTLEIEADVPRWFVIPVHMVERAGSKIMQKVLDTAVPRFLAQLEQDYIKWSIGEDRTVS